MCFESTYIISSAYFVYCLQSLRPAGVGLRPAGPRVRRDMEAAALSLLLAHQSGILNPLVDVIVPVYTVAVLVIIYTVHVQQKRLSQGTVPSDEYLFDGKVGGPTIEKPAIVEEPPPVDGARPNYTGVWKTIPAKNVNYDKFLEVQGVPYVKRSMANRTVITHTIEHSGSKIKLEVQPLNMKTEFNIDGEPTMSMIGKKPFQDTMTWGPRGELVLVKLNKEDQMEITAIRSLTNGGKNLVMKQKVRNLKDGSEIDAEQTFEKS